MFVVEKKFGIRICIDFCFFNKVFKCEYYKLFVLEDILLELF